MGVTYGNIEVGSIPNPICGVSPPTDSEAGSRSLKKLETSPPDTSSRFLGILLALLAAFQYSMSALVVKILGYQPFNLGVWRFGVMTLIPIPFLVFAVFWQKKSFFGDIWPTSSKRTTWFLILQAAISANSIIFTFYGIKYLNVGDFSVIGTSTPIFVTFCAFLFLGERCALFPVLTALLALGGVVIISKPPMLTGHESFNETTMLGVIFSFSSMILMTMVYVLLRFLKDAHHALINFFFALWGLVESILIASLTGRLHLPESYAQVGLIVLSAVLAFGAQTCVTLALKHEQAGPVALVRTMEVVFAFLWQAAFLGVNPDVLSIVGAIVTLVGVVITTLRKMVMSLPEGHKNKARFGFLLL